jgi:hypothetical protein
VKSLNSINILTQQQDGISVKMSNMIPTSTLRAINESQIAISNLIYSLYDKIGAKELTIEEFTKELISIDPHNFNNENVGVLIEKMSEYFMGLSKISLAHLHIFAHTMNIDPNVHNHFTSLSKLTDKQKTEFYQYMEHIFNMVQAVDKKDV